MPFAKSWARKGLRKESGKKIKPPAMTRAVRDTAAKLRIIEEKATLLKVLAMIGITPS